MFVHTRMIRHMGFFGQVPRVAIPEGAHDRLVRSDGSSDDMQMKLAKGDAQLSIDPKTGPTVEVVLAELDKVARQIADEQSKIAFQKLEETTTRTGNVAAIDFDKFSVDDFNRMLDKIEITFDSNGKARLPTILCGTAMAEKLMQRKEQLESDKEGIARQEEILTRKREEFRDRENRRRLVD